ncbi:MAG: OprO/OprP family phosphate-selective porin [Flavobacteriaceae bacterium]|jgi:hypothetical protein|nr:OprO/OprP family phosphate-selective porin [Flavobacteriaceae bacterium]
MNKLHIRYIITFFLFVNLIYAQDKPNTIETKADISLFKQIDTAKVKFGLYYDQRYNFNSEFHNGTNIANEFAIVTNRIYFESKYDDKLSFRLRYNLNASTNPALEFAYLEYRFKPNWSIAMGKLITAWGTYEIDYNGANVYLYSTVGGNINVFDPGVNIAYHTNKQRFNLQFITAGNNFVDPNYKRKALGYLFLWEGHLFDGKMHTRYGYSLMQHNQDKYYNWITLGNRVNLKQWAFELDWMYGFRNINYTNTTGFDNRIEGVSYVKENATALSAKYLFKNWNPFFKAIYSSRNDLNTGGTYQVKSLQSAIEYYPFRSSIFMKDLRLFAVYNYQNYTYQKNYSNLPKANQHQILCGMRWLMPIVRKNQL